MVSLDDAENALNHVETTLLHRTQGVEDLEGVNEVLDDFESCISELADSLKLILQSLQERH